MSSFNCLKHCTKFFIKSLTGSIMALSLLTQTQAQGKMTMSLDLVPGVLSSDRKVMCHPQGCQVPEEMGDEKCRTYRSDRLPQEKRKREQKAGGSDPEGKGLQHMAPSVAFDRRQLRALTRWEPVIQS